MFHGKPDEVQYTIVTKGRRVGQTFGAMYYSFEELMSGRTVLWVDVSQSNLVKYVERMLMPLLKKIKVKYWKYSKQQHQITFSNGAYMDLRSAEKPASIEGSGYNNVILNEAGIILKGLKGRMMWLESIIPCTLDHKANVFFVGVPKGPKSKKDEKIHGYTESLYYELYKKGIDPERPNWRHLNYSSYENPLLLPEDIRSLELEVPPHLRDQEIYGKFVTIDGTGIFKRNWFQITDTLPPASEWKKLVLSADTAFETKESNDDTAVCLILNATNGYYILDLMVGKLEIIDLLNKLNFMYEKHKTRWKRNLDYMLVEKKASGHSVIQALKRKTKLNIKPVIPKEDKYTRASATTTVFESGNVFLLRAGWNDKLINQMTEFNALMDTPDDIVDCVTQAINFFENNTSVNYGAIF